MQPPQSLIWLLERRKGQAFPLFESEVLGVETFASNGFLGVRGCFGLASSFELQWQHTRHTGNHKSGGQLQCKMRQGSPPEGLPSTSQKLFTFGLQGWTGHACSSIGKGRLVVGISFYVAKIGVSTVETYT